MLVVAGPFGKVSPYGEPLPIIARSPNPPRKTTVYVAGEGTRLFDGVPSSYQLDLVSSSPSSNGIVELVYRRHRQPEP